MLYVDSDSKRDAKGNLIPKGGEVMLRLVERHERIGACRYTGYQHRSIRLTLECGHDQVRKASQGVPKRARCRYCQMVHADRQWASTVGQQNIGGGRGQR